MVPKRINENVLKIRYRENVKNPKKGAMDMLGWLLILTVML